MGATGNRLLDALPDVDLDAFRSSLERVHLERSIELFGADQPIAFVDFPVGAVVSLTLQATGGDPIEITMVGPEGVVGAWMALDAVAIAPWTGVAQLDGDVLRLPVGEFLRLLVALPRLRDLTLKYMLTQTYLMSRSVLCNRFHELIERTARWLLIFGTKTREMPLPLTQEFLSQMLGSHRPSVTLALQTLAQSGVIQNEGRGLIRVLDPGQLEAVACDCFAHVQAFDARVMGETGTSPR